jgi:hypothetical protein
LLLVALLPFAAGSALAEEAAGPFAEGTWRLDLTAMAGLDTGSVDRGGDVLVAGTAAYEVAVAPHATLQLRAMPLFGYFESSRDEGHAEDLLGGGVGLGALLFLRDTYDGWYAEACVTCVWHTGEIEGDSSSFDFLSELGVGYQFENDWHVTLKWAHLSNAGFGDDNSGANTIGLSFGRLF